MFEFQDRTLTRVECNQDFIFEAGEQEFHRDKGFTNEPRRCGPCRQAKKARVVQHEVQNSEHVEYPITCARCGAADTVPFVPNEGRPVFCRKCFRTGAGEGVA